MIICGMFCSLLFLGQAFTIMIVYVWARRNPLVRINFFGLLNFQVSLCFVFFFFQECLLKMINLLHWPNTYLCLNNLKFVIFWYDHRHHIFLGQFSVLEYFWVIPYLLTWLGLQLVIFTSSLRTSFHKNQVELEFWRHHGSCK